MIIIGIFLSCTSWHR